MNIRDMDFTSSCHLTRSLKVTEMNSVSTTVYIVAEIVNYTEIEIVAVFTNKGDADAVVKNNYDKHKNYIVYTSVLDPDYLLK
jgi:hypothetical protein